MQTKNVAIISIALMIFAALAFGHDGVLLTGAVAVVAGIAGYEFRVIKEQQKDG